MRKKVSATIITKNEEKNIERCLASLNFVDEIIVVDSQSSDRTVEICNKYNCKVISAEWKGFGKTKAFAVDSTSNDWIFSIDADEVVSEELKNEIEKELENPAHNAYLIKRKSYYLGKLINHSGWGKDYPLRLFNKKFGNFNNKTVHESVKIPGKRGRINSPLLHYTYPNIASHINKINIYTDLSSAELIAEGKHYSVLSSMFFGLNKFLKMYFLKLGFLDGRTGFILCLNSALGVYLKYIKTCQKK